MTTTTNDAIQAALTLAKQIQNGEAIAPIAEQTASVPATVSTSATSYSVAPLDSFLAGPIRPDTFLKVNGGIRFGDNMTPVQSLVVALEAANNGATPCKKLNYGQGANTVYKTTYDGRTVVGTGEDFAVAVDKAAAQFGDNIRVYESVDLIMTVMEDVKGPKGDVIAAAGTRVGYGTPKTGNDAFRRVAQDSVRHLGKSITTPGLVVALELTPKYNARGANNWWTLEMALIGYYDEDGTLHRLPHAAKAA